MRACVIRVLLFEGVLPAFQPPENIQHFNLLFFSVEGEEINLKRETVSWTLFGYTVGETMTFQSLNPSFGFCLIFPS